MKDITDIHYTVGELKSEILTRSVMIEDFNTIKQYIADIIEALENGSIDGECLNDDARTLFIAVNEIYTDINYCWEHDCFG